MNYFEQESERLRFRKVTEEDISSWIDFFYDNDHLIFLGIDLEKSKEELAKSWIMAQLERYKNQGLGHLAVETKEEGKFIGMGGILPRVLKEQKEYEIAYSLKPDFWGKGYATEIAQMMKEFGLKHIKADRLISIIDIRNKGSIRVAQKNGMNVLFQTQYLGMTVDVYGIKSNTTDKHARSINKPR